MVIRKNLNKKFALISVFNKKKLKYLCQNLKKYNYNFISTGATSKKIKSLGFKCQNISEITNYHEILDGRVKTLNPKIFGALLYKRNDLKQIKEFNKLGMPNIDIVIVNLYPFNETIYTNNDEIINEMIDIGGSSLIRAGSKNYNDVTVITHISDYEKLIKNLKINKGNTDFRFRKLMAAKSFKLTSRYDNMIYDWFNKDKKKEKKLNLKYGENPNQSSFIIKNTNMKISEYQLHGKKISYNNIIDVESGYNCLSEFKEPSCVIIKHTNPCGVASSNDISKSFKMALKSDEKSAFGGIVLLNRKVNLNLAKTMNKFFFEIIAAKDFDSSALKILTKKKNLIILKINNLKKNKNNYKSTLFGELHQLEDTTIINKKFFKLVTKKEISKKRMEDLIFATKVVKHLKSNAIALVKNKQTIGLGIGQTNRYNSVELAINVMKKNFKTDKYVCSSDGFFPFTDTMKLLKKNNCDVIAQPFGSINDERVKNFAKKNNLTLYYLKNRLFKH